jgi:D-sedoheptulose 7-phosphate isomerase
VKEKIKFLIRESIEVKEKTLKEQSEIIAKIAQKTIQCFRQGKKVIFFGNGGSAADAQHLATELISRFQKERRSLPAIALTTDTSALTAIGNDYGFEKIFSRQIEGLVDKGDIIIGISTSGNSVNVIEGIKEAKKRGAYTVGFLGQTGGKLKNIVDLALCVPSSITARIQEIHITVGHIICQLVEEELFKEKNP